MIDEKQRHDEGMPPEKRRALERADWTIARTKLERAWALQDRQLTQAQIAQFVRLAEERVYMVHAAEVERDRAVRHASASVYYVRRLRAELDRAQGLIRELRTEIRRRDTTEEVTP